MITYLVLIKCAVTIACMCGVAYNVYAMHIRPIIVEHKLLREHPVRLYCSVYWYLSIYAALNPKRSMSWAEALDLAEFLSDLYPEHSRIRIRITIAVAGSIHRKMPDITGSGWEIALSTKGMEIYRACKDINLQRYFASRFHYADKYIMETD